MSNPRGSLLTKPKRSALAAMVFEHFLHDERPDLAYSTTTLAAAIGGDEDDDIGADGTKKNKQVRLGVRVLSSKLRLRSGLIIFNGT